MGRVDVGGRPERVDDVSGLDDQAVTEIDVLGGEPLARRDRRFVAQDLLDGRREQRPVGDQPVPFAGVLTQPREQARQRGGHRVEAGEHQQEHDVQQIQLRDRFAVDLGPQQDGDDVILFFGVLLFGLRAALGQEFDEILEQLAARHRHVRVHLLDRVALRDGPRPA